jgi:hypothetical protein
MARGGHERRPGVYTNICYDNLPVSSGEMDAPVGMPDPHHPRLAVGGSYYFLASMLAKALPEDWDDGAHLPDTLGGESQEISPAALPCARATLGLQPDY